MEENYNKPKRTLRDVSHHFFSSLEENKKEEKTIPVISPRTPHAVHHFNPLLKMVGIIPIRYTNYSLLMHVYFAKLFLHTSYKIFIVSTNPHSDSWDYLERALHLPSLVDIDFSTGMRTFTLFKNTELVIMPPTLLGDFFSFKNVHPTAAPLGDTEDAPALFLIDCFNVDVFMKEKVASLLDSFVILSSCTIDDIRNAYKIIKAYAPLCPHAYFKYILHHEEDAELKKVISTEFNAITTRFLHTPVDFIGFCTYDMLPRGNNIHWHAEEKDQIFSIFVDFVDSLKKDNWTEELLSFYQTVVSNIKL